MSETSEKKATKTKNPTADELFAHMVKLRASDLHVGVGLVPSLRIDGRIRRIEGMDFSSAEETAALADQLMTPEQKERFAAKRDLDFAYSLAGIGRFRISVMIRRGTVGLVSRHIPHEIPTGDQLGLPKVCQDLAQRSRGLILVTGPTGSGKTTSLAAIIDYINSNYDGHILTLEDPIEFLHRGKRCILTQRQVGEDTLSFSGGLRAGLRQDPDVLMIGEMRDRETIELALTAAETGHLVFGTLHTTSAIQTVDRVVDVFPHESQQQIRVQLSNSLQGILSQTLVPCIGGGRVGAFETLIATDAVRAQIREAKGVQLQNSMQTGRNVGMKSLEESLVELIIAGRIERSDAVRVANRVDEIDRLLNAAQTDG